MEDKITQEVITNLILRYTEIFDEGPPIWGLSDEEMVLQMEQAIRTGVQMEGFPIDKLPPGAYL